MQTFKKIMIVGVLAMAPLIAIAATTKTADAPAKAAAKRGPSTDANADGVITKQEWLASWQSRAEKRFKALDTNADGNVTKEELSAAREKAKQQRTARAAKVAAKKTPAKK